MDGLTEERARFKINSSTPKGPYDGEESKRENICSRNAGFDTISRHLIPFTCCMSPLYPLRKQTHVQSNVLISSFRRKFGLKVIIQLTHTEIYSKQVKLNTKLIMVKEMVPSQK